MSSFTNSIKLNNLQIQLNALETEVSGIVAGGGGGTITADINMNNHSLTNTNSIVFNSGLEIKTTTEGESSKLVIGSVGSTVTSDILTNPFAGGTFDMLNGTIAEVSTIIFNDTINDNNQYNCHTETGHLVTQLGGDIQDHISVNRSGSGDQNLNFRDQTLDNIGALQLSNGKLLGYDVSNNLTYDSNYIPVANAGKVDLQGNTLSNLNTILFTDSANTANHYNMHTFYGILNFAQVEDPGNSQSCITVNQTAGKQNNLNFANNQLQNVNSVQFFNQKVLSYDSGNNLQYDGNTILTTANNPSSIIITQNNKLYYNSNNICSLMASNTSGTGYSDLNLGFNGISFNGNQLISQAGTNHLLYKGMVLHPIYEISFSQMSVGAQQIVLSATPATTTFDSVIIKLYIQGQNSSNRFAGCLTSYAFVGSSPSYNLSVMSNNYESYYDGTPNLLGDVINISSTSSFELQLEILIEGTLATDIKLHYSYMFM